MVPLELRDLRFFGAISERAEKEQVARVLSGLLIPLTGDAQELLEYVRHAHPGFTNHNIQHSWRILSRVSSILRPGAVESLSSVELFALTLAAAFHDVGMIEMSASARSAHHTLSREILSSYLSERLTLMRGSEKRLIASIGFIIEAHGLAWQEMTACEEFKRRETVEGQPIRSNVLSVLLRVGDLLDLDSERSCLPTCMVSNETPLLDESARLHQDRHKHVDHFCYDHSGIGITVSPHSKEEHALWAEWFGYLERDILYSNTYIFTGPQEIFRLPAVDLHVEKAEGATYEMWPLHFQIDEKGNIWDVVSQAIYTGRYDFLRELIQNAIDAELLWIFLNADPSTLVRNTPSTWVLKGYQPIVLIRLWPSKREIEVCDSGVGMGKEELSNFLFKVAVTGYRQYRSGASVDFPSIARFGIGFVSILVRAKSVAIETRPRLVESERANEVGRKVLLNTDSLHALSEVAQCETGTKIRLLLKDDLSSTRIREYLESNFVYPSLPLVLIDEEQRGDLINVAGRFQRSDISKMATARSLPRTWDEAKRLSETVGDITRFLDKREGAAPNRSGKTLSAKWRNTVFLIPQRRVYRGFPKRPIAICLDKNFRPARSFYCGDANRHLGRLSLLWVPVRVDAFDKGIEWRSLHGIIVNNGRCEASVVRYTGVASQFDDGAKTLFMSGRDWEQGDVLEDLVEQIQIDTVDVIRRQSRRREFGERENDTREYILELLTYADRIVVKDGEELLEPIRDDGIGDRDPGFLDDDEGLESISRIKEIERAEAKRTAQTRARWDLVALCEGLDNSIFQDGIRLPVSGWEIAPIGACRSLANLSGDARMELNVTRNALNEAPFLIRQWVRGVGRVILQGVVDNLRATTSRLGLELDIQELIAPAAAKRTVLYEYVGDAIANM